MTSQFRRFLGLFPLSALFWWSFEYLNRFTQNWHYAGVARFSGWEYFWLASLSFATVLPAVWSTRELLATYNCWAPFKNWVPLAPRASKLLRNAALLFAILTLAFLGIAPDYLFPCIWISPFILLLSSESLVGRKSFFSPVMRGDWSGVVEFALAALICGFFWEMWNQFSLAHWVYSIPWVGRFRLFEMPLAGYSGYFTFGWECAAVGGYIMHKEIAGKSPVSHQ
jgi:hypothetical protein